MQALLRRTDFHFDTPVLCCKPRIIVSKDGLQANKSNLQSVTLLRNAPVNALTIGQQQLSSRATSLRVFQQELICAFYLPGLDRRLFA